MNKNIARFIILVCTAITFTACVNEEDDIFGKTAAERLNEVSGLYTSRLVASGGTWIMEYYPTNSTEAVLGLGRPILCQFAKDKTVVCGMKNSASFNIYMESQSMWDVITDDGPVLTFNTCNDVLHTFSEPHDIVETTEDDELGRGFEGDYEFIITSLEEGADHAMLKGKKRGTYNRMTRLPADVSFFNYLMDINSFTSSTFVTGASELRLDLGDLRYNVSGMSTMLPMIYPREKQLEHDSPVYPYLVIKYKDKYYLRFRSEVGEEANSEQEFVYHPESDCFKGVKDSTHVLRGLEGEEVPLYLASVGGMGFSFIISGENPNSAAFNQAWKDLVDGFKASGNELTNVVLAVGNDGKEMQLKISYKLGRGSTTAVFKAPMEYVEGGLKFGDYTGSSNTVEALKTKIKKDGVPVLANFLNILGNGTFKVEGTEKALNLKGIRMEKTGVSPEIVIMGIRNVK